MRIRLKKRARINGRFFRTGAVLELPADRAHIMLDGYRAERADTPTVMGSAAAAAARRWAKTDVVLVIPRSWGPQYGGGELTMLQIAKGLSDAGHKIEVAARFEPKRNKRGWWSKIKCAVSENVEACIRETRPCAVVFQDTPWPSEAAACRELGIPYIIQFAFWKRFAVHDTPQAFDAINAGEMDMVVAPEGRAALWGASAVFGNSAWTCDKLDAALHVKRAGLCQPKLLPSAICKGRRFPKNIVMPQAQELKGLSVFLGLARDFPQEQFTVHNMLGHVSRESETAIRRLPNVKVRKWTDNMAAVYRQAKIVCICTQTAETFCRSAAEARANGVPLLVSDGGNLQNLGGEKGAGEVVSRKAEYPEWKAAFERVLAMNGRAKRNRKYATEDGPRHIVQAVRAATCAADIAMIYPEGALGVSTGARHLAGVTGMRLYGMGELARLEEQTWRLVILTGGFGKLYQEFVRDYSGPVAINWRSDPKQMRWHPHEKAEWECVLDSVRRSDNCRVFLSSKPFAAELQREFGDRAQWLPDCYAWQYAPEPGIGGRGSGVGEPTLPLLGPDAERKRFDMVVEAAARTGFKLLVSRRLENSDAVALAAKLKVPCELYDLAAHGDVINLLRDCSLAAFPSEAETFCYAALEAMLCGLPTIVSRHVPVGKYQDARLRDSLILRGAKCLAPNDMSELALRLDWLKGDKTERQRLGEGCRAHAHEVIKKQNAAVRKVLTEVGT